MFKSNLRQTLICAAYAALFIVLAVPALSQQPAHGTILSDTIVTFDLKVDSGEAIQLSLREGEMGQVNFGGTESYGFIGTLPDGTSGELDLFVARLTAHESGEGAVVEQVWRDDIALGGSRHFDVGPGFELTVAQELGQAVEAADT